MVRLPSVPGREGRKGEDEEEEGNRERPRTEPSRPSLQFVDANCTRVLTQPAST